MPDENGASTVHEKKTPKAKNSSKDSKHGEAAAAAADTSIPESPAVIDAEHHESKFRINHQHVIFSTS